jgi:hypothetical protein
LVSIVVSKLFLQEQFCFYCQLFQKIHVYQPLYENFRNVWLLQNRALRVILKKNQEEHRLDVYLTHSSCIQSSREYILILLYWFSKLKNGNGMLFTRDATATTLRNANDIRLPRYHKTSTLNMIGIID